MNQFYKLFCGGFCVSSLTWALGFPNVIWGEGRIKCVLEKCPAGIYFFNLEPLISLINVLTCIFQ